MVNLEGGKGEYNLSIFTRIGDKTIRKVADYFVKEGIINAGEYFAINNPDEVNLWGIEDTTLYLENLTLYRNSLKHKDTIDKHLNSLNHVLSNLKRQSYSKELLEFDEKCEEYKKYSFGSKEHIVYLSKKAEEKKLDTKSFPNIRLLCQSFEQEENIDLKKVNSERNKLIDEFQKMLSNASQEELILKALEFKEDDISQYDFCIHLYNKAKLININMEERFPEFQKYIAYISSFKSVNKEVSMKELENLENAIKEALYTDNNQRELNTLYENFTLLKNMFNISITREDYDYYKENKNSFNIRNFTSFIEKEAREGLQREGVFETTPGGILCQNR